jgi:hypothetical protein
MTNYVDLDELRGRVFFRAASLDDRFIWEKIPDEQLYGMGISDGFERFRLIDCAHRPVDRDGDLCTHCGHAFPYAGETEK